MVIPLKKEHTKDVAKIHKESLPGDFLPSLGLNFLVVMYENMIQIPGTFGFVEIQDNQIRGFVIGTKDMKNLFNKTFKTNTHKLVYHCLISLIKQPKLIIRIVETFLYPHKEKGPEAELIVIAVLKKWQGKGVGKKLTEKLEEVFIKKNIYKYKVAVHKKKKANLFYKKLGYLQINTFTLYSRKWILYEKKIA